MAVIVERDGTKYCIEEDGTAWEYNPPAKHPQQKPTSDQLRIAQLEGEAAMLALELVATQIRLDQSESDHTALLFELVDKEVL